MKNLIAILSTASLVFAVTGCSSEENNVETKANSYLDATVAPFPTVTSVPSSATPIPLLVATVASCTPIHGSKIDPCGKESAKKLEGHASEVYTHNRPYTIGEIYQMWVNTQVFGDPLFAVRATFIPDTTRCTPTPWVRAKSRTKGEPSPKSSVIMCVTDMRVGEYMVGSGANRITVVTGRYQKDQLASRPSDYEPTWHFDWEGVTWEDKIHEIANDFEGKEWILWLTRPFNVVFPAWEFLGDYWYLQREGDEIVVYASDADGWLYSHRDYVRFSLPDYRRTIKAAFSKHLDQTVLRAAGASDPVRPEMATEETLRALAIAEGALDHPGIGFTTLPTVKPYLDQTPQPSATSVSTDTPKPTPTPHPAPTANPTPTTTTKLNGDIITSFSPHEIEAMNSLYRNDC